MESLLGQGNMKRWFRWGLFILERCLDPFGGPSFRFFLAIVKLTCQKRSIFLDVKSIDIIMYIDVMAFGRLYLQGVYKLL